MEVSVAVEQHRSKETPLQRFLRELATFGGGLVRIMGMAAILTPIVIGSLLTLDIPIRAFDHFFTLSQTKPSNWLTYGGALSGCGAFVAILIARRFGGDEASRVIIVSWAIAALAAFAEISYLAPRLEAGDFPSVQFIAAFVSSAMIGQFVAVAVYDVARGGGAWWRPPLYSALSGFAAHSLIFFSIAYWAATAPWLNWMVADFSMKTAMAIAFLAVYSHMRRKLKPRGGFGG